MKAVWTTLGCWAAAAAPTAGVDAPFDPFSISPFVCEAIPILSPTGLLNMGGPIEGSVAGVTSIGSRGGVRFDELADDGRMGMDLCIPWAWWSVEKGLWRISAADAMAAFATMRRASFAVGPWG